jgi:hypothetical protein
MLLEDLIEQLYGITEQDQEPLVIKKEDLKDFINKNKGKIMTIVFRKKDGTVRTLNTRTGVRANITGKGLSYDPDKYGYLILWDLAKKGYRTVTLDTIQQVKANRETYPVVEILGKKLVTYKNAGKTFEGESAWRMWKRWADFNRRDEFLYKVLESIKLQRYYASVKQQQVLNQWFNRKR